MIVICLLQPELNWSLGWKARLVSSELTDAVETLFNSCDVVQALNLREKNCCLKHKHCKTSKLLIVSSNAAKN